MIKMGRHCQKTSHRGAKRKAGGGAKQAIVGRPLSIAVMVEAGIALIVAVNRCWREILSLLENGTMKGTMVNCQSILRDVVRKKYGGNVIKAIDGSPLSIIVPLGMDVRIAAAGMQYLVTMIF